MSVKEKLWVKISEQVYSLYSTFYQYDCSDEDSSLKELNDKYPVFSSAEESIQYIMNQRDCLSYDQASKEFYNYCYKESVRKLVNEHRHNETDYDNNNLWFLRAKDKISLEEETKKKDRIEAEIRLRIF